MNIAIIDADLTTSTNNRFPNLACMKLSGYYKSLNHNVTLKTDYKDLSQYDKVFISKVFTKTEVSENILTLPNVQYGGTGFFYDKAPPLPPEIEHHMPDYHLYDEWVQEQLDKGTDIKDLDEYLNWSIGRFTLGCIRGCKFCVNQHYKQVEYHAELEEFYDLNRNMICLLDDNIFAYKDWKTVFNQLISTNKPFKFKNGIDLRVLNAEKIEVLSKCKYKGDITFAFDNITDKEIIQNKLVLWKSVCKKSTKLYVLCGFDVTNTYDLNFWKQDIIDTFERIKILMKFGCLPYIMRYNRYEDSPYRGTYINLTRWCNQPNFFKKKSYREFCIANQDTTKSKLCATMKYMNDFESQHPQIAYEYFDLKYDELNQYNTITI